MVVKTTRTNNQLIVPEISVRLVPSGVKWSTYWNP